MENKQTELQKSFFTIRWIIILLLITSVFYTAAEAQNTIAPATVKIDTTLTFKNDSLNFLKKIVQPIKFRDNRNRKEKERIYLFMQGLVQKGQLKIDSSTVNEIMVQLDTINFTNKSTKKSIEDIITANELDKKASSEVIDSLKMQITAVVQEIANNNLKSKEKQELLNRNNTLLKEIRNIQYASDFGQVAVDSLKIGSTYYEFNKTLETKTTVIGWHNSWNKTEYLNYNYNYLSALNLYGFELSAAGKCRNPEVMNEFQKPGGVIKLAQRKNCDVHLTIYSKYPAEIERFLKNTLAQKTFLDELNKLINNYNLKGINIYFDFIKISDSQKFVRFINDLQQNIKNLDDDIQLYITIPVVTDDESLTKIGAYNFMDLNALVDYYFVLTDELTSLTSNLALGYSPLYNSSKYGQRTIESTINFYSNGKIPVSKLIVTLSYLGIEWNVKDFLGTIENWKKGKQIKYNEIIDLYKNNQEEDRTVVEGIDSSQVAAYLNVSDLSTYTNGKIKNKQIWFEDSKSLFMKYNWVLENGLGGIAIRGLGYDDGYSELWDVLGTTLLEIDTIWETEYYNRKLELEICPCEYDSMKNDSELRNIDNWKMVWANFLDYKKDNPDSSYLTMFFNDYDLAKIADLRYAKNVTYNGTDKSILSDRAICWDLICRWYVYSRILFGITLFSCFIALMLNYFRNQLDRFMLGNDSTSLIIMVAFWLSIVMALMSLLLGLFLEPNLNSIGAGNQGESNFWILVKAACVGIVLGIIFKTSIIRNKYNRKNQP